MKTFIFVGTYTQKGPNNHREEGIYTYTFDPQAGKLLYTAASNAGLNPSFLRLHPNKRNLYAVNETTEGEACALEIDPQTGAVKVINAQVTNGAHPCFVSFDPDGKFMLISNYSSGSLAVFPIRRNGSLGEMSGFVEHGGSGPNRDRQKRAHAHSIAFDLNGRYVLAADLGIDRMLVYRLSNDGRLNLGDLWGAAMKPGAGPRHFACHPNGGVIYVANELDSTVTACRWDGEYGLLTPFQNLSTLPPDFTGENSVADIHIDAGATRLYVSNRGHNSLAVYGVDGTGSLDQMDIVDCGGNWPRNFALAPGGWLLCANQFSDSIAIFKLDPNGMPVTTGEKVTVPSPVCLEIGEF
jgi:6-phosphogluconolactonase